MKITNIVATVKVAPSLDLEKIAHSVKNTEFAASGAKWLKMRVQPENKYVAFYKSGKFLVTGVNSIEQLHGIAERVASILKGAHIEIDEPRIIVHNIVVSEQIEINVPLEHIIYGLDPYKSSYEPEQFPSILYKDWGVSFLLFSSGKVIISGIKKIEEIEEIIEKFKEVIEEVS